MKNLEASLIKKLITSSSFLFLFFFSAQGFSQNIKTFNNVEGCHILQKNESIEYAEKIAFSQAKLEALNQAGVEEQISSTQLLTKSNNAFRNKENFYESIQSNLEGEITRFDHLSTKQSVDENGNILICVTANVDVLKYGSIDRNPITFEAIDLSKRYKDGDDLNFRIRSGGGIYFYVFYVDDKNRYQLIYPSELQPNNNITTNLHQLPHSSTERWVLNTSKDEEKNNIILVAADKAIIDGLSSIRNFNTWAKWYMKHDIKTRNMKNIPITIFKQ
jgi:hypothetical protein